MAEQSGITLAQLFPDPFEKMELVAKSEMTKSAEVGRQHLAWGFVGSQAESALRSALDCDVFELIARGWCTGRELHEYTDATKHPRGERSVLHLGEHALTSKLHPMLMVTVGRVELPRLRFTLDLTANFRAVALAICNGHITAADTGDAYVSATLKYGDVKLHRKDSRKIKLPGRVIFEVPGLPIG